MEDTNNTLVIRVKKKHIQSNRLDNTPIQNDIIIKDDVISHQKNKNLKQKTQKKKSNLSEVDKSKLWEAFDVDNQDIHTNTSSAYNNQMECLYENSVNQIKESGICGFCDGILVISEEGFPICSNNSCGIIYKNTLDYSPEWRFYGADDKNTNDPTRCGNPINPLLVESSFGCKVLCSTKSTYEMRKIRKWTEWQSMPHKEKSLYDEFQFITIMAQNAGIPKIFIDDAMAIHKDISEQKMFRGMNRDGIKSASIYISCRLNGCPRTAHEIAEIFKLDKTSATNGCSMAVNILHNIERNFEPSRQTELCSTKPSAFIERYCSKLNMNNELTMLSKFIAKKVEDNNIINDNTPHSIAAGIVYFVSQNCNMNINKLDIKVICGVSEVTINKCFKKLENIKSNLIPSCILEKYM
jgi:transcription initiation factor TFIIB